ncbi:hypothetical protein [Crocosphaera sp. XPORK-15E]|uniref:hypothetical protein n=1 Tax=Crocosphaera sp. XPORK-15E TaxID=3110247 RepID=UPI002B215F93|nr:hypothetical protein [Crocosphaera sp. XPORK-15E]MEA5536030.1 hypothetical protein [Crocosphaera sp. XPORK-15E]
MSQTPITVTYSLEEILKEINNKLDKIDEKFEAKFEKFEAQFGAKFDTLQKDVNDLKVGQTRLEEKLTGDIKALEVEVKGINKRLDSQEFINRSIAVGLVLAIGAGLIKFFFPNFPNVPH